jgi:hypothetical protein
MSPGTTRRGPSAQRSFPSSAYARSTWFAPKPGSISTHETIAAVVIGADSLDPEAQEVVLDRWVELRLGRRQHIGEKYAGVVALRS